MGEQQVSRRQEEAKEALQQAYEQLPPAFPWGYFHYLDGPVAAGGGVGCFAWFRDEDELYSFIREHQVWLGSPPSGWDLEKKQAAVNRVIDDLLAGKVSAETAQPGLEKILQRSTQIGWWGHFEELLTGDGEFPREVREWYRDSIRGEVADDSLFSGDIQDFFQKLQVFGI